MAVNLPGSPNPDVTKYPAAQTFDRTGHTIFLASEHDQLMMELTGVAEPRRYRTSCLTFDRIGLEAVSACIMSECLY